MDKIVIKRNLKNVLTLFPLKSSTVSYSVMGEEQVVLSFELNNLFDLQIGDYIVFDNITFTLNKLPTIKKLSSQHFRYNCIFQAPLYELAKVNYLLFDNTNTTPQGDFSLTGTPDTFVDLLVANLNRVFGANKWQKGAVVKGKAKTLSFSTESCFSVLERLAKEYKTEFSVVGNVVNLQKITQQSNITLEYGNTLYDIERQSVDEANVITRLYAFGSERNLPKSYRAKRLLPKNSHYLESNVSKYGVIEGQKTFDDIYPRLSLLGAGTITSVENHLTFRDENLDFDINDFLILGTTAKVHFLTGDCAGYECEIEKYKHSEKNIKLIANTDDESLIIPNKTIKPKVGDKYVLLDIEMPQAYIEAAEQELLNKATEYLSENSEPKVSYSVTFSELYAKQNSVDIRIGDMIRLIDNQFGIDTLLRVVNLNKGIKEQHSIKIEISNTVSSSTLQRILDEIKENKTAIKKSEKGISQVFSKNWAQMVEISKMVETLRTDMLFVGDVGGQFLIKDTFFSPNYSANANWFHATVGKLVHKTIPRTENPTTWNLSAYSNNRLDENTPYYLYAKCSKIENTGVYYLDSYLIAYDSRPSDYFFLVGMLSSAKTGSRTLQTTYGFTTISGNQITTGKIQSADGSTYFDLDNGRIGGSISFESGSRGLENIEEFNVLSEKVEENKQKTKEIEDKIPLSWELVAVSDKGVNAFNYGNSGTLNQLIYSVKWYRSGKDVTEIMRTSSKHLFDFERKNLYGVDDNGITDEAWNAIHKGRTEIVLTDKDIYGVGNINIIYDDDLIEKEYQRLIM